VIAITEMTICGSGALSSLRPLLTSRATERSIGQSILRHAPHLQENTMTKTFMFAAMLTLGVATAASAGVFPVQRGNADGLLIITVAEGCGPGMWRGPGGRCHPMFNGRACPPGYHLGPERRRCWPN
jgi:hypothetical protein